MFKDKKFFWYEYYIVLFSALVLTQLLGFQVELLVEILECSGPDSLSSS